MGCSTQGTSLPRAGTPGNLFTVAYTPIEYGKPMRGMLVIVSPTASNSLSSPPPPPPRRHPTLALPAAIGVANALSRSAAAASCWLTVRATPCHAAFG